MLPSGYGEWNYDSSGVYAVSVQTGLSGFTGAKARRRLFLSVAEDKCIVLTGF